MVVGVGKLLAEKCMVDTSLMAKMGELLDMQITSQLDAMDFVVGRYVLASRDGEWELTKTSFI